MCDDFASSPCELFKPNRLDMALRGIINLLRIGMTNLKGIVKYTPPLSFSHFGVSADRYTSVDTSWLLAEWH